jgi:hypothetical protein
MINNVRTDVQTTCTLGKCTNLTTLLSNSTLSGYTDTTFKPIEPNQYKLYVKRNVDGAVSSTSIRNLDSCQGEITGLNIQYDPNITLNPPLDLLIFSRYIQGVSTEIGVKIKE